MALGTYSDLQAAVVGWSNRSDLAALIPDFITLAEERMNRELRVRQMETPLAATTIADNAIGVASNTVGVKTLWITGYESEPLLTQTYDFVRSLGTEGRPTHWAWVGGNLHFDGAGDVEGVLYAAIPALSADNTTNWLLTAYPSLYLAGALTEAFIYVQNDKERDRWNNRFLQTLADIQGADMRDRLSGPLAARAR